MISETRPAFLWTSGMTLFNLLLSWMMNINFLIFAMIVFTFILTFLLGKPGFIKTKGFSNKLNLLSTCDLIILFSGGIFFFGEFLILGMLEPWGFAIIVPSLIIPFIVWEKAKTKQSKTAV